MDKNIDEVKLTDAGLTVNDIKSNNKKEKPSIVTFKQFAKMLRKNSTQDISPTAYAHAASSDYKIDEGTEDVYSAIGKKSGNQILDAAKYRSKEVNDHHDSIFGNGNQHLDMGEIKYDIPEHVREHIERNGDTINHEDDSVTLSSGRRVHINKYLGRSLKNESPENQKQINAEWQEYTRNKSANTKLVLSRHPGDIASGSTGTHWNSCADLNGRGPAAQVMPAELEHGTMIAMHVHKDATPSEDGSYHSKDILGRMYVKQHRGDDGSMAFIPEGRSYGVWPKDASKKLDDKFTSKLTGLIYKKHQDVYNDTRDNHLNIKTKEDIDKALKHQDPDARMAALDHPKVTAEHISKALDDKDLGVRMAALDHPKVTAEHISKALDDEDPDARTAALDHPKVTSEHISKALDDEDRDIRMAAIKHPKVTSEHISKALGDEDTHIRLVAARHPNATVEHISKALSDKNADVRFVAIKHPKVTSEHISKALGDTDDHIRTSAIRHPNATVEHISKALDDEDSNVRLWALDHPKVTAEHISKALDDKDPDVRLFAKNRQKDRQTQTDTSKEQPMVAPKVNESEAIKMKTSFSNFRNSLKLYESKSEKCKDCGSEDCHCELSDKEIDDLVNSVSDEDFADLYEPNEFAEVDEDGKPLKESLDEASDMKKVVVRYKPKGASTPIEHVYVVPKTATEKDVIALHKRSFGGGIGGVRTQNESEQINEVLSREERIRQAARFAMTQSRRDRKRQIALHRFSGGKVIAKRARRMAMSILKKRMMKGRDISKLSIGEKERLEARIQRMKNTVARIAVRLTSKIRKIEKERMSHPKYTKKD